MSPALARAGLAPTRLALGCAPLAGLYEPVDPEQALATVDAAWERGVRTFDTAPHYGAGLSERRLGAALRGRPRDEAVVCTKVGRLLVASEDGRAEPGMFPGEPPLRRVFDFSRDGVLRSLEASLERLGLDRVDVVHVHDPDDALDEAIATTVPVLAGLRDAGVIGAVGAGMNDAAALARIVREADVDCVLVAGRYTLLDQSAAEELLPLCAERGVDVIAGGVFNSGVLAAPGAGATYDYAPAPRAILERAERIAGICLRHGVSPAHAALRFPLRHPAVTSVVVGARSPAEVADDADGLERPIPEALWADLAAADLVPAAA